MSMNYFQLSLYIPSTESFELSPACAKMKKKGGSYLMMWLMLAVVRCKQNCVIKVDDVVVVNVCVGIPIRRCWIGIE